MRKARFMRVFCRHVFNSSIMLYVALSLFIVIWRERNRLHFGMRTKRVYYPRQIPLWLPYLNGTKVHVLPLHRFSLLAPMRRHGTEFKDGDIKVDAVALGLQRKIQHEFEEGRIYVEPSNGLKRGEDAHGEAHISNYYAFDDDYLRGTYISTKRRCRRTAWHRSAFPTCNSVHEIDVIDNKGRILG